VRRMSIIEDGELAEVLYLIPKQSMMEQLPFINPEDYILCEKLAGIPAELSGNCDFVFLGFVLFIIFMIFPHLLFLGNRRNLRIISKYDVTAIVFQNKLSDKA